VGVVVSGMLDPVTGRTVSYILSAASTIALYLYYVFSSRGMRHMTFNHGIILSTRDDYNSTNSTNHSYA
jgi:hypothetical protein